MDKNLRAYMAELLGTFGVVFVAAGAVIAYQVATTRGAVVAPGPGVLEWVTISLATGLALAACLAATLPLSGGFLNPAVTIALWACKRMDGGRATALVLVQLLGAAIAGGVLRFVFGFYDAALVDCHLGATYLNLRVFDVSGVDNWTRLRGIGVEAALTFILTFVIFATTVDPRTSRLFGRAGNWLVGLWVGLVAVALTLVGFPVTGAAMNPARWVGPAIWETTIQALKDQGPFVDGPVYVIGPVLGAILAGGAYTLLIMPPEEERHAEHAARTEPKVAVGSGSTLFRAKK